MMEWDKVIGYEKVPSEVLDIPEIVLEDETDADTLKDIEMRSENVVE